MADIPAKCVNQEKERSPAMDRYDFASVVDDTFKECSTVQEATQRYEQMRKDLETLFRQNIALLASCS